MIFAASMTAIVGGVVGVLLGLVLIIAIAVVVIVGVKVHCHRKRQTR